MQGTTEMELVVELENMRLLYSGKGYYVVEKREEWGWSGACIPVAYDPWDIPLAFSELREPMKQDMERRKREKYGALYARIEKGAKPCFVRFGRPPKEGRSYDYRANRFEAGVAVYRAWEDREGIIIDLRDADQASALFLVGIRPLYIIEGEVVGVTSDNTPAVKVVRWRKTNKPYKLLLR